MPTTRRSTSGVAKNRSKAPVKANQTKLAFHGQVSKRASEVAEKDLKKKESTEAIKPTALPVVEISEDDVVVSKPQKKVDEDLYPPGVKLLEMDDDEKTVWEQAVLSAKKVTDAKIKSYWSDKERERITLRVHQEGMSLHEKVLADWDIDSKFGVSFPFSQPLSTQLLTCN